MIEPWILWSSELSPFGLKVAACLVAQEVPFRWMPAGAGFLEAKRFALRRERLVRGDAALTYPELSPLDELPQVPFLFGPANENLYDSSAIAVWLDNNLRKSGQGWLLPKSDPVLRLAVSFLDEAFDEFGLYLVHHGRWVRAAHDNDAGARLAVEMRPVLGPGSKLLARAFPARQVRRLPYLFSVAPEDQSAWQGLPKRLRPPSREGFPATHELLETATSQLLRATEGIFGSRPFLFGDTFTLADASLFGQLGMNRSDPAAWQRIQEEAPVTAKWVENLAPGGRPNFGDPSRNLPLSGALLSNPGESLVPLLNWAARWFSPLMYQNAAAWKRECEGGATLFNEAAFDQQKALYDGEVEGHAFRSVVKTFQVRVWQDLQKAYAALADKERSSFDAMVGSPHLLDQPRDA